jgi:hypothetical protein
MHQKLQTNRHGSVKRCHLKFGNFYFFKIFKIIFCGVFQEMVQLLMTSILVYTSLQNSRVDYQLPKFLEVNKDCVQFPFPESSEKLRQSWCKTWNVANLVARCPQFVGFWVPPSFLSFGWPLSLLAVLPQ